MAAAKVFFEASPSVLHPGETTAFRLSLYRLFSECLLHVPSPERLSVLAHPRFMESARILLGSGLENLCSALPKHADVRDLATEYAALFVIPGPSHTCPYETYYRDRYLRPTNCRPARMLGYTALQVQRAYAQWRVPADLNGEELPDHAGVELRFMSFLIAAEKRLNGSSLEAPLTAVARAQAEFLSDHILRWFPEWLDYVIRRACQPFYKTAAIILKRFLEVERDGLGEPRSRLLLTAADQASGRSACHTDNPHEFSGFRTSSNQAERRLTPSLFPP